LAIGYADHALADYEVMTIVGLGCRKGATQDSIAEAFAAALERFDLNREAIHALATEAAKGTEAGIIAFANEMSLPLILVPPSQMKAVAGGVLTVSERVVALKGVPSVAETSALAAAGRSARLLGPRTTTATVSCAVAVGEGP
jgi:cobalt-precorrin 5A hydrolase